MMRHYALRYLILSIFLLPAACGIPRGPEQRYELKGTVVFVDLKGATVSIAHEAIPGYMEAMTMPFKLKDDRMLADLAEGDAVQATLVVSGTHSWLEDMVATRQTPLSRTSMGGSAALVPQPGDDVPDFSLKNQDGKRIKLSDYRGKSVLITFIYTRCPLPDYCPLMTSNFASIQKELTPNTAVYPRVHLLTVTVDPEHDSPDVLRSYGSAIGADFSHWEFGTGTPDQIKQVSTFFGLAYWPDGEQIVHSLRTAIIGGDGKLVRIYNGNEWKPEQVIRDLKDSIIYTGSGVVEAVDRETSTIQINHSAIDDLMPAMSMPYMVKEKSLLDAASVGDKIEFTLSSEDSGLVLKSIKKLGD